MLLGPWSILKYVVKPSQKQIFMLLITSGHHSHYKLFPKISLILLKTKQKKMFFFLESWPILTHSWSNYTRDLCHPIGQLFDVLRYIIFNEIPMDIVDKAYKALSTEPIKIQQNRNPFLFEIYFDEILLVSYPLCWCVLFMVLPLSTLMGSIITSNYICLIWVRTRDLPVHTLPSNCLHLLTFWL